MVLGVMAASEMGDLPVCQNKEPRIRSGPSGSNPKVRPRDYR